MGNGRALGVPRSTFTAAGLKTLLSSLPMSTLYEPGRDPVWLLEVAQVLKQGLPALATTTRPSEVSAKPCGPSTSSADVSMQDRKGSELPDTCMWLLPGQLQGVPVGGHSCIRGGPELPVALAVAADLKRSSQLALNTFTEWLWKPITTISSFFTATRWGPTVRGPTVPPLANQLAVGLEGEDALTVNHDDVSMQV